MPRPFDETEFSTVDRASRIEPVSNFAARHSMDTPEWYTPSTIVEPARRVFDGVIDLDPASHEEANRTVKAERYYTEQDNGLIQPWDGSSFVNPPGGLVNEFWHKWCVEWLSGRMREGIWVGYSLEQLQTLQNINAKLLPWDFAVCYPRKRIAFIENEAKRAVRVEKLLKQGKEPNKKSQPSHANYIVYAGKNTSAFFSEFAPLGRVEI